MILTIWNAIQSMIKQVNQRTSFTKQQTKLNKSKIAFKDSKMKQSFFRKDFAHNIKQLCFEPDIHDILITYTITAYQLNLIQIFQLFNIMESYKGAERLQGFDKPRVWSVLTPLANQLKAANLGQGFPTWNPPDFYLNFLTQQVAKGNHQYVRSFGSLQLVNAIAKFHEKAFLPYKIDPLNDIVTTNGGSEALFCSFMGILNPGDEAIFFDPSYDCYRSQIQMAGGKAVGLPLKPKKKQSKQQVSQRIKENKKVQSNQNDEWLINFQQFQNAINQKTKIVLINSPHNPVGKVFTQQQLKKIAQILYKHPRIVVIEDNVYQGMIFDQLLGQKLPKIIHQPNMYQRTVSVYSAGKIFAATGVRCGWAIGSRNIIQSIRSVHTYNVFCYYNVLESAIGKSLDKISDPNDRYMIEYPQKLELLRNKLVEQLANCKLDIDFWIPKGSNFIIADISRCQVKEKYFFDENGGKRTKDYAFALQLIYEQGVSVIPCSPFYSETNLEDRQRYIRLTFCKDQEIIKQAGRRLRENKQQNQKV